MNYDLINQRESTGLSFTIMTKNKKEATRDSPFIRDKNTLKTGVAYLFKMKSDDAQANEARFLHYYSNIGPEIDLSRYLDDPEEFKYKTNEIVEDVLFRSEQLIEQCINNNSRKSSFKFTENSDIAFDPIISCSADTTRLLLERFNGDANEAGKYLTELAMSEIIPNIIGEKEDDFHAIAAAQIDNGLLHLHTVIFRVKPNLKTIDFNPQRLIENINYSRVKTTLNHLDIFHLREKDKLRACRLMEEGKLDEFLDNQEVLDHIEFDKNFFHLKDQQKAYEEITEIFEKHKTDKHILEKEFKSAGYSFTYKKDGKKTIKQTLWLPDGRSFSVDNLRDKELQKLSRKIIELKRTDEEYSKFKDDLTTFNRLEEIEDFILSSDAKTIEELNSELSDIGASIIFNIDKSDNIKGATFYDKKHNVEIKAFLSDGANLQYLKARFNLNTEVAYIRANNELYKNKKQSLKVKTLSKYKKFEYIPRAKSNFKKFRFSEFENEDAFFKHFKSINAGHSLVKTMNEGSKYYNAKRYFQFEIISDSTIAVANYNGKTNSSAIKAALQYAVAAGATEVNLEDGTEADKKEAYKIAVLMGLKVKGFTPDINLQKEINETIANKTAEIENRFLSDLNKFIAEKKQAEENGEEFTKKLYVKNYAQLQLEVDSTAFLINTLHCVASGLSTKDLINVKDERMLDELAKLKMLAAKAYPDDPRVKAAIQYWESLQASGTSSTGPQNTNKPAPNQKPFIRPRLDI